jgi:hypothetical protein
MILDAKTRSLGRMSPGLPGAHAVAEMAERTGETMRDVAGELHAAARAWLPTP